MPTPRTARPSAPSRSGTGKAKNKLTLAQALRNVHAATAALHNAIDPRDKHSQGMAAVLAYVADTVVSVIEARRLNATPARKPKSRPPQRLPIGS